jgi:hypothetical protein
MTKNWVGRGSVAAAVLALVLLVPALAFGSGQPPQPGVHIDPGSPSAKEYAVPLGSARGSSTPNGPGSTKLFGSGVTPSSQSPPPTGSTAVHTNVQLHHARKRVHHRRQRALVHRARASVVKAPAPASVLNSGSGGGVGAGLMVAAAALVLALGGFGAFVADRRGRRTSPGAGYGP